MTDRTDRLHSCHPITFMQQVTNLLTISSARADESIDDDDDDDDDGGSNDDDSGGGGDNDDADGEDDDGDTNAIFCLSNTFAWILPK